MSNSPYPYASTYYNPSPQPSQQHGSSGFRPSRSSTDPSGWATQFHNQGQYGYPQAVQGAQGKTHHAQRRANPPELDGVTLKQMAKEAQRVHQTKGSSTICPNGNVIETHNGSNNVYLESSGNTFYGRNIKTEQSGHNVSKNESHNEYTATRQASFAMTATGNAYDMRAYTDIHAGGNVTTIRNANNEVRAVDQDVNTFSAHGNARRIHNAPNVDHRVITNGKTIEYDQRFNGMPYNYAQNPMNAVNTPPWGQSGPRRNTWN